MDRKTKSLLWKVLILAAVIVVILICFWSFQNAKKQTVAIVGQSVSASSSTSIAPRMENGAATRQIASPQQSSSRQSTGNRSKHIDWPTRGTPVDTAIESLQPLADSGDTEAMLMLSSYLEGCRMANRGTDDVIRQHVIDNTLQREQAQLNGRPYTNELESITGEIAVRIAQRDQCAKIDFDRATHWFDWIARAAQSGDTNAMVDYASHAFEDFYDHDQLLNNFDEVTRRRAIAATYLQQALEQHNCNALIRFEWAYAGERGMGALFAPDPSAAYAYELAGHLWQSAYSPAYAKNAEGVDVLADRAKMLNADQILAAQTRGTAIFERYCRGVGE